MAIPSGSGTEVIYRGTMNQLSSAQTAFRWDRTDPTVGTSTYTVPANHIITVLSIVYCESGGADELLALNVINGASDILRVLYEQSLPAKSTFVFNDKIVLVGGDKLITYVESTGHVDVVYSFIDQDWS